MSESESNAIVARICIFYISLPEFNLSLRNDFIITRIRYGLMIADDPRDSTLLDKDTQISDFLEYAAREWTTHVRQAGTAIQDSRTLDAALTICNTLIIRYHNWFQIHSLADSDYPSFSCPTLAVLSYCGLEVLISHFLQQNCIDVNQRDVSGRTALSWAALQDRCNVVRLLMEQAGSKVNLKDKGGQTPLSLAV